MTVIRDVLVKITTDNTGLTQGLDAAKGSLKAFGIAAAAALGAATGAFVVMTGAAIKSASEMELFAKLSNSSTREFQRMAAAVSTVGIEQDKLADILKDVNDRVGDFMSTGAGPMADFFERVAPLVGVTAEQFRGLSGPQALQLYVDTLQKAGASQQDMTFYLEAMASDATALIPLLKNDAAELNRLADAAERVGAVLSEETIAQLNLAKQSLFEIQSAATGFQNEIVAAVAPALAQAAAALADMSGEGGPVAEAIDRIAASFGALAEKMASPEFIAAATSALTLLIDLAARGADALIWLSENFETAALGAGVLGAAIYAAGGPIGWVIGLLGLAATGLYQLATAEGVAGTAANTAAEMQQRINQALSDYATAHGPNARAEAKNQIIALKAEAEAALTTAEAHYALNEARAQAAADSGVRGEGLLEESAGGFGGMSDQFEGTFDEQATAAAEEIKRRKIMLADLRSQLADINVSETGGGGNVPVQLPGFGDAPGLPQFTPDAGGGGGGENETQTRLDALQNELATERELLAEWYAEGQTTLEDALAQKLMTEEEYRTQRERLEAEHAERMTEIDRKALDAKLEMARTVLGGLSALMGTENKKLFKIGQAAAIAQATIDGWAAATSAWKHGMATGGPPLAAAYTAASLAKTGAMIASIASQSASGGGGSGSGGGGGSGQASAPQAPLDVRLTGISADTIISGANMGSLLKALSDEAGDRGLRFLEVQ